jgi:excisionase family DNA binding protein
VTDKLLTSDELAEALQVCKRTVKTWLSDGVIPAAIREGQVLRFDLPAVKRALAKRAAKNTPRQPCQVATY